MAAEPLRPSVTAEDACDGFSVESMDLTVRPWAEGGFILEANGFAMRCAVGRTGLTADKHEGDGGTPIGRWALREGFYRPDKMPAPQTRLPMQALKPSDGWCDAPGDPNYNKPVQLPYRASHEELWRKDDIYDVIVVMGYNDDPPTDGRGSAIFLHISRSDYSPTAGCVAVPLEEMMKLLALVGPETHIVVSAA
ncbi:hypothetical protein sos41_02180 [Alphaproteobacteria bacterium SO-S41]|nr:hypothetical protein sos41_02180 [Alphaproteobacteria bacterium SO-S41]